VGTERVSAGVLGICAVLLEWVGVKGEWVRRRTSLGMREGGRTSFVESDDGTSLGE
jgi:hypothetical protein